MRKNLRRNASFHHADEGCRKRKDLHHDPVGWTVVGLFLHCAGAVLKPQQDVSPQRSLGMENLIRFVVEFLL